MNIQQTTSVSKTTRINKIKSATKKIQLSSTDLKAIQTAERLFKNNNPISFEELYDTLIKSTM